MMSIAVDYHWAAVGRFLIGFGSAFAFVGALKLAAMWLPIDRFAFFSGCCASLGFLGAAGGAILLAKLVHVQNWRLLMQEFAIIGITLAAVVWVLLGVRKHKCSEQKTNLLTWKQAFKQLLVITKNRYVWSAGVLSSLMFLPTSVFAALWGVPYLQKLHHFTLGQATFSVSMIFIGWAIGCPLQGMWSDRIGNRIQVVRFGAFGSAILATLLLYDANISELVLNLLFVLFGILSSAQVLTFAMARDVCAPSTTGMAIAFVNTLAMIGGMVFQRGVGQILDFFASDAGQYTGGGQIVYSLSAYKHAMAIVPISLFLAGIISLFIKDRL